MEKIITPRGTFKVEELSRFSIEKVEELNKEGYGFWFSITKINYIDKVYIKQGKTPILYKVLREVLED